jgi:two-component system, NarL family, nitrate/nitrite response regulator NarL
MPDMRAAVAPAVRIVIADDHTIFRDGLRRLLESEQGFAVAGEAANGEAALDAVDRLDPDVLLLDVAMPGLSGLDTLEKLVGSRARVLVLTAAISEAATARALQLGARGVVLKEAATRQLLDGIRAVVAGKYVLAGCTADSLGEVLGQDSLGRTRPYNLTRRELDIVSAIVAGRSNKEIAERFAISVQTVKHHLTSIFDKTSVSSRLELALLAVQHRLAEGE